MSKNDTIDNILIHNVLINSSKRQLASSRETSNRIAKLFCDGLYKHLSNHTYDFLIPSQ
jgi:hypothetical protein